MEDNLKELDRKMEELDKEISDSLDDIEAGIQELMEWLKAETKKSA